MPGIMDRARAAAASADAEAAPKKTALKTAPKTDDVVDTKGRINPSEASQQADKPEAAEVEKAEEKPAPAKRAPKIAKAVTSDKPVPAAVVPAKSASSLQEEITQSVSSGTGNIVKILLDEVGEAFKRTSARL